MSPEDESLREEYQALQHGHRPLSDEEARRLQELHQELVRREEKP